MKPLENGSFAVVVHWEDGRDEELPGHFKKQKRAEQWIRDRSTDWLKVRMFGGMF